MPAMVSFRGEECLGANVRLRALSTDSHVHEQLRKSTCITKPRRVTVNLPPGHLPRTLAPQYRGHLPPAGIRVGVTG